MEMTPLKRNLAPMAAAAAVFAVATMFSGSTAQAQLIGSCVGEEKVVIYEDDNVEVNARCEGVATWNIVADGEEDGGAFEVEMFILSNDAMIAELSLSFWACGQLAKREVKFESTEGDVLDLELKINETLCSPD